MVAARHMSLHQNIPICFWHGAAPRTSLGKLIVLLGPHSWCPLLGGEGKGMIRKEGRKEGGGYMEGEQRRIVPKNGRLRLSTEMRLF